MHPTAAAGRGRGGRLHGVRRARRRVVSCGFFNQDVTGSPPGELASAKAQSEPSVETHREKKTTKMGAHEHERASAEGPPRNTSTTEPNGGADRGAHDASPRRADSSRAACHCATAVGPTAARGGRSRPTTTAAGGAGDGDLTTATACPTGPTGDARRAADERGRGDDTLAASGGQPRRPGAAPDGRLQRRRGALPGLRRRRRRHEADFGDAPSCVCFDGAVPDGGEVTLTRGFFPRARLALDARNRRLVF